ncbi:Uncharacterised protein [Mycobacteroides abscessus subsp. abscessus]|nr:Uncharacterised protein [Mycobacteroides abscessus subsp. abscessus]
MAPVTARRTVSSGMSYWFSRLGLSSIRTAGSELPPTCTSATPRICAIRCAMMVDPTSYNWPWSSVLLVSASTITGADEGLRLL